MNKKEVITESYPFVQAYLGIIQNVIQRMTSNSSQGKYGVKKEVKMARNEKIPIIQIKPQGTNTIRVENAGVLYD